MEFRKTLVLFLFLSVCSVGSFPSRPLNDRPSELAWQAWLLVDSQNQQQNDTDRRITPKSVFIAPKLGQRNDSLPDCADGYRADSMGRCHQFIKVDENAHLDFLLKRLNEMYASHSSEEDEVEDILPTAGPLQVNIPLGQSDEIDINPEIAVVVAPTNGQFDDKKDEKVTVKRTQPNLDSSTKEKDDGQVESPLVSQLDNDYVEEYLEEEETTVQTEQSTTTEVNTEVPTTIVDETTEYLTTTDSPTTMTDSDELKALFFLMPTNNSSPVTNDNANINTSTIPPAVNNAKETDEAPVTVKDRLDPETELLVEDIASLMEPAEQHHKSNHVRFPSEKIVNYPENVESIKSQTSDIGVAVVNDFYNNQEQVKPHNQELTSSQIRDLFRQYIQRPAAYVERPNLSSQHVFNHRNRDRNEDLWKLTPTWRDENIQKPLVLRFGRYPPTGQYPQHIYNSKRFAPHHEAAYYGEQDGQEDYSNVFGRKRRRGNFR